MQKSTNIVILSSLLYREGEREWDNADNQRQRQPRNHQSR